MTIKYTFCLLIQALQDTHDVSTSMHISCKGTPLIPLKYGYFLLFFFFEVFLADFFFDFFLEERFLDAFFCFCSFLRPFFIFKEQIAFGAAIYFFMRQSILLTCAYFFRAVRLKSEDIFILHRPKPCKLRQHGSIHRHRQCHEEVLHRFLRLLQDGKP